MNLGKSIVCTILATGEIKDFLDVGMDAAWLKTPESHSVFGLNDREPYRLLLAHWEKFGTVNVEVFEQSFPPAAYHRTERDQKYTHAELIEQARKAVQYHLLVEILNEVVDMGDDLDGALALVRDRADRLNHGALTRRDGSGNSWEPVDLTQYLTGDYEPLAPTICMRADGQHLFYRGKTHSLSSETEGGKTWLALYACAQEIDAGNQVLYLDFEDGADTILERLSELVHDPGKIGKLFRYIRPEGPLTNPSALMDIAERSTFVVIDGITEAMAMHGLNPLDNADVAKFNNLITNPLAARGPAVLSLDHVVKDPNSRGRYQIGGVHKLNAISGVSYLLLNEEPFGRGRVGKSRLLVAKDRPGQVRQHGTPELKQPSQTYVADLLLDNRDPEVATELRLTPPAAYGEWRPHHLMAKASKLLAAGDERYSKSSLAERMGGNAKNAKDAINYLVSDGYAEVSVEGRTHYVRHLKPYHEPAL